MTTNHSNTEDPKDEVGAPAENPQAVATGVGVILEYLKTLPSSPGVYRMLDSAGDVIYVGKARSLKARVSNYTRLAGHTNRIARMPLSLIPHSQPTRPY